jgi:phosphoglycerate dehydrogenase-like enzyme
MRVHIQRRFLPFASPRLRLLFCTASGLDAIMPFSWVPPGLVLLNNCGVHGSKMSDYAAMALLMLNARVPRGRTGTAAAWASVVEHPQPVHHAARLHRRPEHLQSGEPGRFLHQPAGVARRSDHAQPR